MGKIILTEIFLFLLLLLIQGISTIFINQLPTCDAFRKVHSILASEFSLVYHIASQILRMKRHNLK
jgi:hypothetical protein